MPTINDYPIDHNIDHLPELPRAESASPAPSQQYSVACKTALFVVGIFTFIMLTTFVPIVATMH